MVSSKELQSFFLELDLELDLVEGSKARTRLKIPLSQGRTVHVMLPGLYTNAMSENTFGTCDEWLRERVGTSWSGSSESRVGIVQC